MTLPARVRRLAGRFRSRSAGADEVSARTPGVSAAAGRGPARRVAGGVGSALAVFLVFAVLVGPDRLGLLTPGAFLRIPLEGLLVAALLLALPARPRRLVVAVVGPLLGLLAIVKLADLGFRTALDRPFDLVLDWLLLDDAFGFVRDSAGRAGAVGAVIGVLLLVGALLLVLTLALRRLASLLVRHERVATRAVASLTVAWVACAVVGVRIVPGVPVADAGTTALVGAHATQVDARLHDRERFGAQIAADPFDDTPGDQLLTGLRGKDVILAFVESYGRDAVEDPELAPQVNAVLDAGTEQLRAAGYHARSGFLTSPTFGGGSWLAHDTLLSGLWTDNEQRHRSLLASDRLTLNGAFRRAGWETVGVLPAATQPWPEQGFFDYDRYYDAEALGYRGPKFSYAPMPDQYTLSFFQRQVRAGADRPVMAEIPLISSHSPWTAVPRMIGWDEVGDGSIYHGSAVGEDSGEADDRNAGQIRGGYRQAIAYSLETLISYVQTYGDDDLVLVFLGDHQPSPVVTGEGASRDVPITIVARDPAVLDRAAGWGWQDGLRPGPEAPVWPMDTFRDRFLTTFGPSTPPIAAPR
ncbi:sulfatase-like hydrolase/transferase [Micromonospora sp. CV4]|uniref:sulfatase-like hydrolase/transferase n=1 Tax=Micromonospora sp. CV4 TaxID=2478711 RepID=UPI000EF459F2|nr:sulfatase-like hydrolase/transferase [Micromonospora sp. CV4]RLP88951.1 sulfatase [Micromonospora sp. CV4]